MAHSTCGRCECGVVGMCGAWVGVCGQLAHSTWLHTAGCHSFHTDVIFFNSLATSPNVISFLMVELLETCPDLKILTFSSTYNYILNISTSGQWFTDQLSA